MPAYYVSIALADGTQRRVYGGHYSCVANAVFGCMRKDDIDRHREVYEETTSWREGGPTASEKAIIDMRRNALREYERRDKAITCGIVTGMKVPKKVHRAV